MHDRIDLELDEDDLVTSQPSMTVLRVSELNQMVRDLLEDTFPAMWIEGEVSNLAMPVSGHIYFTLKDSTAQVRCAFFKVQNRRLNFQLENGMHVQIKAQVSLYPGRGDFQLIVEELEQTGDGALARAFELLKEKLSKEGLFDEAHKKAIPNFPQQIGVITSATGAAVRDILTVLKRRFPGIPVIIYPSQVQGDTAPKQLIAAIKLANRRKECDALILARGGGSLEDLAAFNDEQLARIIFASEIPLISAVGHEIDFTIADFVADQRAPTPSAAAELVSPDHKELLYILQRSYQQLMLHISHLIESKHHTLLKLEKRLQHPGREIQDQMQHFDYLSQQLHNALFQLCLRKQQHLQLLKQCLQQATPFHFVKAQLSEQKLLRKRFYRAMQHQFSKSQQQFEKMCQLLDAVSPFATLSRGYAVVRDHNKQIIRTVEQVKKGQLVNVRLFQGELHCLIEEIES